MSDLERTSIGPFTTENGLQLSTNEEGYLRTTVDEVSNALQSPLSALPNIPTRDCDETETTLARLGRALQYRGESKTSETALLSPSGKVIGLAAYDPRSEKLQPRLVFDAKQ